MTQPTGGEALRIYEKTLACVHCGLCLPACPAYENAPRESLAPRGQVFNARALLEGRLPASDGLAEDLYECLACRGCETVCPAGVEVGAIVEGVRGLLDEEAVEPRRVRVLKRFALGVVVARPAVLNAAMWLLRFTGRIGLRRLVQPVLARLAPKLAARERLLPDVPARERFPARISPGGEARGTVALFLGCVAPHLRPETSRAAIEALTRNGWEVVIPEEQGCCGALHLHAGLPDLARPLARRNVGAFPADLPVVTTAAGCGAALSEYGELLDADHPRAPSPGGSRMSRPSSRRAAAGRPPPAPGRRRSGWSTTLPATSSTPSRSARSRSGSSAACRGWNSSPSATPSAAAAPPGSTT